MSEQIDTTKTLKSLYEDLAAYEPQPVDTLVPSNLHTEIERVASGEINKPQFDYDTLDSIDFELQLEEISRRGRTLLECPDMNPKYIPVYESVIERYIGVAEMLMLMKSYRYAADDESRRQVSAEFMRRNIELFGEPDEQTYRSLLGEQLSRIDDKTLLDGADVIRQELFDMVSFDPTVEVPKRFSPAQETVDWAGKVIETLYEGMLSNVPDQDTFSAQELADIFEIIIREEFEQVAEDWRVEVADVSSVVVHANSKIIKIPASKEFTKSKAKGLVVHEIGVHVMTAIMGEQADLYGLDRGIDGHGDTQEGIAKMAEQALVGKYKEAGIGHSITTGLSYFDGMSSEQVFEVKWRLSLLTDITDGEEVTDDLIKRHRARAAKAYYRIFRGTDELPWFKDASYYLEGTKQVWQYMEKHRGDELRLTLLLMGKRNISEEHTRIMLETATP